jgi:hypothetical protein
LGRTRLLRLHAGRDRARIEAPTGEIDAMCLELVGRAIDDENICAG